jgi:hypothetical protein
MHHSKSCIYKRYNILAKAKAICAHFLAEERIEMTSKTAAFVLVCATSSKNEDHSAKSSSTVAQDACQLQRALVPPVHVQGNVSYHPATLSNMLYENAHQGQVDVLMVELPLLFFFFLRSRVHGHINEDI